MTLTSTVRIKFNGGNAGWLKTIGKVVTYTPENPDGSFFLAVTGESDMPDTLEITRSGKITPDMVNDMIVACIKALINFEIIDMMKVAAVSIEETVKEKTFEWNNTKNEVASSTVRIGFEGGHMGWIHAVGKKLTHTPEKPDGDFKLVILNGSLFPNAMEITREGKFTPEMVSYLVSSCKEALEEFQINDLMEISTVTIEESTKQVTYEMNDK